MSKIKIFVNIETWDESFCGGGCPLRMWMVGTRGWLCRLNDSVLEDIPTKEAYSHLKRTEACKQAEREATAFNA